MTKRMLVRATGLATCLCIGWALVSTTSAKDISPDDAKLAQYKIDNQRTNAMLSTAGPRTVTSKQLPGAAAPNSTSAKAPPSASKTTSNDPPMPPTPGVPEGTCPGTAITAPGTFSGNTCGAGNDCALRPTEDVHFEITIPTAGVYTFSLCSTTPIWDSYIYLGTACCLGDLGFNDDFCGGFANSQISNVNLTPGIVYLAVEGFTGANCGAFELVITSVGPCELTCPSGATQENEPDCGLPVDTVNGGCNSAPPVFGSIACGETVCGTAAFDGTTRDTDWYEITLTADTEVTFAVEASFDVLFGKVDFACCAEAGFIAPFVVAAPCTPNSITVCLGAGTYWFFVAPQFTANVACGALYVATLTCNPCTANTGACCVAGSCSILGAEACTCAGGVYLGDGTLCDPGVCDAPANDDCLTAIDVGPLPATINGSTSQATADAVATCVTAITAPGVWYNVTGTGNTITATTCDGNPTFGYDTKINVYCGDCANLICVTGNDDDANCPAPTFFKSTVTWCSSTSTVYHILVQGFGGATGNFQLSVTDDGTSCPNPAPCEIVEACLEPSDHCQTLNNVNASNSTTGVFICADDFTPATSGNITNLCWWGTYTGPIGDSFTVSYYASAGGLPGALLGSFVQGAGLTVIGPSITGGTIAGIAPEYEYAGTHDPVAVVAGQCYWVEIVNTTPTGTTWFWEWAFANGRALQDGAPLNGYDPTDAITNDLGFCLNLQLGDATPCVPCPPLAPPCCKADMDGNGTRNGLDVSGYVDAHLPPFAACGSEEFCRADADDDGFLTSADHPAFVALILASEDCPLFPDNCADANTVLTGVPANGTTIGATPDGTSTCPGNGSPDVWYIWTSANDCQATASLCGSAYDTVISVHATPCIGAQIVCIDDFCGLQSQVVWNPVAGQQYLIRIGGFAGQSGNFTLLVTQPADCTPLPNDDCEDAIAVAVPSVTNGSTTGASPEAPAPPTCVTTITAPGVWYSVTGTGNTMTVTTCDNSPGTGYDTKLNVYCGSCTQFFCVTGNDDTNAPECVAPTFFKSRVSWCSAPGQVYLILVQGFNNGTGDFVLTVSDDSTPCSPAPLCAPPPCPIDFTMTAPGTVSGDTCNAGNDCALRTSLDQMVEVTIPVAGTWSFSLCSTTPGWDSFMYVGTSCCTSSVGFNDDFCGFPPGLSQVGPVALAAGTYYVDIEAFGAACTPWTLVVSGP